MQVTLVDQGDGTEFDVEIVGGVPVVGGLLVVASPDDTDRRVYEVNAVNGTRLTVVRKLITVGTLL
jgi:hypothetical protein